ncbi:sensor domain-containing diguanylate cyclase [Sulfurimonas paralvinellae]|uniref:diguanylate cyclase n=1 Tax=Sulfurimonas paralvinellae TaxID=317658 RepID=A0A7M1B8V8_9BACT|nr:diguanylate cyclase [Sulfurimonas paralvinellae]QOP46159.1 diguanylate cyclase [Sulfurimonas paralvinellae]
MKSLNNLSYYVSMMNDLDYKTLFESANVAMAVIEQDSSISLVNKTVLEMFQIQESEVIGTSFLQWIYEEDRDFLKTNHQKRMQGDDAALPKSYEVRMLHQDSIIWVSLYVRYIKELNKSIVSFTDITYIHNTEEQLQEQLNAQNALLSAIPDLMFELSLEGVYLNIWAHNSQELTANKELLLGKKVTDVLEESAAQKVMQAIEIAYKKGSSFGEQIQLKTPSGDLWFELSSSKKENLNSEATVIMLSRNITDRKELEMKLLHLSRHDSLTNLYNRRTLETLLQKELHRSQRYKTPLSICMLDIDFFKKINDTYGHATGDDVLKKLADVLRESLRDTDYVGRYGGEEFVIALPDTSLNDAVEFAQRLRKKVAAISCHPEEKESFNITISLGVAELNSENNTVDKILEAADSAMYRAKESGRNCVKI